MSDSIGDSTPAPRRWSQRRERREVIADDVILAGISTRVSIPTQASPEKTSLEEQEAHCRRRLEELALQTGRRLEIVKVWRDAGVSGAVESNLRGEFAEAIEYALSGRINLLIGLELDRLWRDSDEAYKIRKRFDLAGVELMTCRTTYEYERPIVAKPGRQPIQMTSRSKWMFAIDALKAEDERHTIQERFARGRHGQAEKGKQPMRSRAPLGYGVYQKWESHAGRCTPEQVGRYYIKEEEAATVRLIFTFLASGASCYQVTQELHARGIKTVTGKDSWHESTIRTVARYTCYYGDAVYGKSRVLKDETRREEGLLSSYRVETPESVQVRIPCPAIVTREVWQQANDAIASNQSRHGGNPTRRLLSGLLVCPECGRAMTGRPSQKDRYGNPTRPYYACGKNIADRKRAKTDTTPRCLQTYINGLMLERQVLYILSETLEKSFCITKAIATYRDFVRRSQRGEGSVVKARRERLEAEQEQVQKAHDRAQSLMEQTLAADPDAILTRFIVQAKEARLRLQEINRELTEVQEEGVPAAVALFADCEPSKVSENLRGILRLCLAGLQDEDAGINEKRGFLHAIIESILPMEKQERKTVRDVAVWTVQVRLRPEILVGATGYTATTPGLALSDFTGEAHRLTSRATHASRLPDYSPPKNFLLPSLTLTIDHNQGVSCHVSV